MAKTTVETKPHKQDILDSVAQKTRRRPSIFDWFTLAVMSLVVGVPEIQAGITQCGFGECLPLGCSNTSQSINGYLSQSDLDLFRNISMGGGSIGVWAGTDPHPGTPTKHATLWSKFDTELAAGFKAIFLEICPSDLAGGLDRVDTDLAITLNMLLDRGVLPEQIWVTGLQYYPPGHVCVRAGAEGPEISNKAADVAVLSHGVNRGPVLSLSSPAEISADDCHLSSEGQAVIGKQIKGFFDDGVLPPPPNTCGDQICSSWEDFNSCPEDCAPVPPGQGRSARDRSSLFSIATDFETEVDGGYTDLLNPDCVWRIASSSVSSSSQSYTGSISILLGGDQASLTVDAPECPVDQPGSFTAVVAINRPSTTNGNDTVFRTADSPGHFHLMLRGKGGCNGSDSLPGVDAPAFCQRCYTQAEGRPTLEDVLRSESSVSAAPSGDWTVHAWIYDTGTGRCDQNVFGEWATIDRAPRTGRGSVGQIQLGESGKRSLSDTFVDNAAIAFGSKAEAITEEDICAVQSLGLKGELGWCEDDGFDYRACSSDAECGERIGACDFTVGRCIGKNRIYAGGCELPKPCA